MGRYYSGDIEGKFWFAIQSSDAADRFGIRGETPNYLTYSYMEEDLEGVQKELKRIEEKRGEVFKKLDEFFEENDGYSDKKLATHLKVSEDDLRDILSDYADYELGKKIEKCIIENGICEFEAEL